MRWTSATSWLGRVVMVTGASGFLGGAVARLLLELGASVHGTGCCRLPIDGVIAHRMRLPDEVDAVMGAVRPSVIFHLASPTDLRDEPALYDRLREGVLDGTAAVASAALRLGARLVHVGAAVEYGGSDAALLERAPAAPRTPYAALKAAASDWVLMLHRSAGLNAGVVRPFSAYGPGDARGPVGLAAAAALQGQPTEVLDGARLVEWNHVDALAEAIVAAGAHPDAVGRVVNLGGGPRAPLREVVERVYALAGADLALVRAAGGAPSPDALIGDHGLARSLWGEIPQPDLEDGLTDTLDWLAAEADL